MGLTSSTAAFQLWAPKVYNYYHEHDKILHAKFPHLKKNFERSIFSCATFNFGPTTWTFKHRDARNCPFGWCAIQSFGPFDPKKGGHLILWELKLVIEFPPGATILIPSATVTHSNVPVQPGDERVSFTQYTSGSIFCYVDNGCMTEEVLEVENPEEYARLNILKSGRWARGLALLSTLDELAPVEN